jgi:hypothetical protein
MDRRAKKISALLHGPEREVRGLLRAGSAGALPAGVVGELWRVSSEGWNPAAKVQIVRCYHGRWRWLAPGVV